MQLGYLARMHEGNIKVEREGIACATVVWAEIDLIKTESYRRVNQP